MLVVLTGIHTDFVAAMFMASPLVFWIDVAADGAYGNGSDHFLGPVCCENLSLFEFEHEVVL